MYLADSRSAQTAAPDTRPGRRPAAAPGTVLALGAVSLITGISSEMVTAVLPLYVVTVLGLSPLGFGVLDGIDNGVGALVRLLGGRLADRDGGRRHTSVAGIGYGLSALCKPVLLFGVTCLRFHAAAGTGIFLWGRHGALQDTCRAVVLDSRLHELHRFPAAGIPTRARVTPSGHLVARTVLVNGASYAGTDFSTRTAIVDTAPGRSTTTWRGTPSPRTAGPTAPRTSTSGVSRSPDGTRFHATLATHGRTYLVRGDVTARTLTTLHGNVERPSLSPDGTRIAYKKRVPGASPDAPWRLYVLHLRRMSQTATAEQRNIDDQAVWADDSTLVHALPGDYGSDLWAVPADGTGAARRLMTSAVAPAYPG
ncbi:TolB-like translocation protein [Streptomyces sp. NPDC088246]|uniref:TolB-like translocation protein n=1 Tax=Streptomyces sp. NPDC088246 TaxID=3365842 RepID=UPI0038197618